MLTCFNMKQLMPYVGTHEMYEKFSEAILKFYATRYRPEGKKALIPTLSGSYNAQPPLETRNFNRSMMVMC